MINADGIGVGKLDLPHLKAKEQLWSCKLIYSKIPAAVFASLSSLKHSDIITDVAVHTFCNRTLHI